MSEQGPPCNASSSCAPQLKFYQAFTFATPIIFTLVLLLLFCVLYVRRRQTARAVSQLRAQFFARGFSPWPADHGLTKSFRATLPTIVFDEEFGAARGNNVCAICLGDYQVGEKLQQLPGCDHIFHVQCIDGWLANSSTCPICRGSLLQGKVEPSHEDRGNRPLVLLGESSNRNDHPSTSTSGFHVELIPPRPPPPIVPAAPPIVAAAAAPVAPAAAAAAAAAAAGPEILPEKAAADAAQDSQAQDQGQDQSRQVGHHAEGPSQRSVTSMEEAVKDSAEHAIQIER